MQPFSLHRLCLFLCLLSYRCSENSRHETFSMEGNDSRIIPAINFALQWGAERRLQ